MSRVNDDNVDENHIIDNNQNDDHNDHIDHNDDDNDNNFHNGNGDQTIMILQAMHFGEPLVCEKARFSESKQILRRLHS